MELTTITERRPWSAEVRQYAADLLGHLNKSGSTVPGGFTTKLFELWAVSDIFTKAIIAQGRPMICLGAIARDGPAVIAAHASYTSNKARTRIRLGVPSSGGPAGPAGVGGWATRSCCGKCGQGDECATHEGY